MSQTTVQDIISGIIAKKEAHGLTNQQIADIANVSKSTIDRLMRNDGVASTTAQTLFDVADAVGYRIGGAEEDPAVQRVIDLYEARIRQTELHHAQMMSSQNHWLRFLSILCVALFAFVIVVLLYDVMHPDVGWIQDRLEARLELHSISLSAHKLFGIFA